MSRYDKYPIWKTPFFSDIKTLCQTSCKIGYKSGKEVKENWNRRVFFRGPQMAKNWYNVIYLQLFTILPAHNGFDYSVIFRAPPIYIFLHISVLEQ